MNNDSVTHNVALSLLMSQHATEQIALASEAPTFSVKVTKEKLARSARAKKSKGERAAPIHGRALGSNTNDGKVTMTGLSLPDKGSLNAVEFIAAMLSAGKRQVEGKTVRQEAEIRNDQIKAIAGFMGWNPHETFGSQEVAARMMANRIISGGKNLAGPSRQERRSAERSLTGFVSGLPNLSASKLDDLRAREVLATDAMLQHEKDSKNPLVSDSERETSRALMLVERERLDHIQSDIREMQFR